MLTRHSKFNLSALAAALYMLASTPSFALEAMDDSELSSSTGEGLAYFAENLSLKMGDTDYIKMTSAGGSTPPVAAGAVPAHAQERKGEFYLYGLQVGATKAGEAPGESRNVDGVNLGSADNPSVIRIYKSSSMPSPDPDAPDQVYDIFEIAQPEFNDDIDSMPDDQLAKMAFWADYLARSDAGFADTKVDGMAVDRMRVQLVIDKASFNGTKLQLWKPSDYPDLDYDYSITESSTDTVGGIMGTRIYTPNADEDFYPSGTERSSNFDASQKSALLDGTGVSTEYLLRSDQIQSTGNNIPYPYDLRNDGDGVAAIRTAGHNRYWYIGDGHWGPVFVDNHSVVAGTNKQNRAHNAKRQREIEKYSAMYLKELARMAETYRDKIAISGTTRANSTTDGVMRLSAALSSTSSDSSPAVSNATSPAQARFGAATVATAPSFNNTEGLYWKDFDNNMVLGKAGLQPVYLYAGGDNGKELVLEVARIPNNPAVYNQMYIDYSNSADIENKTCTPTNCPDTATHSTLRFQLHSKNAAGDFTDAATNYYGLGLGENLANPGSAGISVDAAGSPVFQSLEPLPASVNANGGTYNRLDGLMIQHLKLTTNAFD